MKNDVSVSMTTSQKLGFKTKMAYAIGQMGDSIGFNIFYFFFLFFLTDFAGVSPAIAGTISLIAVLWDAITDPIIGYISDNLGSKHGRRRPMMIGTAIPYAISLFLLFNNVNLPAGLKNVYFIAVSIAYWTFYTAYVIPYFALGAELTQDFDERTSLRVYASAPMYIAVMLASAFPPMILEKSQQAGMSTDRAWNNVGLILGLCTLVAILICWNFTRGREIKIEKTETKTTTEKINIFKVYKEVFLLKPTKYLTFSVFFMSASCAMMSSGVVYLMNNNLGLSAEKQSTYFVIQMFITIGLLPFISFLSGKLGKEKAYLSTLLFTGISVPLFYVIGINSFLLLVIWCLCYAIGNGTFWTLYYSMMYDISELDEYVYGLRREGAITSIMALFQKIGAAVSMWLMGILLEFVGYDGTILEQTESALRGILRINTVIVGVMALLSGIIIIKYPLNKKRFERLQEILVLKREGKEYSTEGIEELL